MLVMPVFSLPEKLAVPGLETDLMFNGELGIFIILQYLVRPDELEPSTPALYSLVSSKMKIYFHFLRATRIYD